MKVNKTQAALFILERLLTAGKVSKGEIYELVDITDHTFYRYIEELRAYFANFGDGYHLVYHKSTGEYELLKN